MKLASPLWQTISCLESLILLRFSYLKSCLNDLPKLLALVVARVPDLEVPSLGDDLLGSERPFGISPSGILPPMFNGLNFRLKEVVLFVCCRHGDGVKKCLSSCQLESCLSDSLLGSKAVYIAADGGRIDDVSFASVGEKRAHGLEMG